MGKSLWRPPVYAGLPLAGLMLLLGSGCAVHPKGLCGASCPIIESATHIIEYPSQRLLILKRVAARNDLTQHEQLYLVNAVFMGGYGDDMADALVALIKGPCCTAETRQHIREKIKLARMMGRAERRIVEELEKADAAPTPALRTAAPRVPPAAQAGSGAASARAGP